MEMVDKGEFIDIHRASIASFNTNSVVLSNGTTLNCSAVVFASGWERTQTKIIPPSELLTLGLPFPISQQPPDHEKHWSALDIAADEKVCSIFPFLRNPPPELFQRQNPTTPFQLYRYQPKLLPVTALSPSSAASPTFVTRHLLKSQLFGSLLIFSTSYQTQSTRS
jgi:hypothetical protein